MLKHISKIVSYLFVFALFANSPVVGQSKEKLKKKQDKLKKEIALTNELIKKTTANKKATQNQLKLITKKINSRNNLIKSIKSNIYVLEDHINNNKTEIDSLAQQVARLKKEYAEMVYYAYKTKSSYSKLMYVFSANSFNQAYKRLKYIQQFSEFRKTQVRAIEHAQDEITQKNIDLKENIAEKTTLLSSEEQEKLEIEKDKKQQEKVVSQLSKDEKKLKKDLKKKVKADEKLRAEIKRIIAEEIRKAREEAERLAKAEAERIKREGKSKSYLPPTPVNQKLSADFAANRGKLPWPVARGVITQSFGPHQHPILKKVTTNNDGVDIGTVDGAAAKAVFSGEVSAVIVIPGAGKAILVRHGEYLTVYSNLAEVFVKMGDKITTSQTIGRVLTDKEEGKTELKFQIWKGTIKLNPSYWLLKA